MIRSILICLIIYLLPAVVKADPPSSKSLITKVVDSTTGEPLVGVKVKFDNMPYVLYTDMQGKFVIPEDAKPNAKVQLSLISYQTTEIEVDIKSLSEKAKVATTVCLNPKSF